MSEHDNGNFYSEAEDLIKEFSSSYSNLQYDDSLIYAKKLLKLYERVLGTEHVEVATIVSNLASVYVALGQLDEAESSYNRALLIYESHDSDDPKIAFVYHGLASAYLSSNKFNQAEIYFNLARKIHEKSEGADSINVASCLCGIANSRIYRGISGSIELFEKSLSIFESFLRPNDSRLIPVITGLGKAFCSEGNYVRAEPLFKKALDIGDAGHGDNYHYKVTVLSAYAELKFNAGDIEGADVLCAKLMSMLAKYRRKEDYICAEAFQKIATIHYKKGLLQEAETLF